MTLHLWLGTMCPDAFIFLDCCCRLYIKVWQFLTYRYQSGSISGQSECPPWEHSVRVLSCSRRLPTRIRFSQAENGYKDQASATNEQQKIIFTRPLKINSAPSLTPSPPPPPPLLRFQQGLSLQTSLYFRSCLFSFFFLLIAPWLLFRSWSVHFCCEWCERDTVQCPGATAAESSQIIKVHALRIWSVKGDAFL